MDCFDRGINMLKVLLWHLVKHVPYCCGSLPSRELNTTQPFTHPQWNGGEN